MTSDRSTERRRIARASRVSSTMCGCTSTQRTVSGTGICLTCGLSMPTVSTSPPNSDGAMLSTCTEPLATASPCIANLSSCVRSSGASSSAAAATTPATADAAEPPSPSRAECPCRSRARSRNRHPSLVEHARARPCRRCSSRPRAAGPGRCRGSRESRRPAARVRSRAHAIAERRDRVSEDVEADSDVADARRRERRRGRASGRGHNFAPRYAHTRSRSANTPAAVTAGPAPGPCTISGLRS